MRGFEIIYYAINLEEKYENSFISIEDHTGKLSFCIRYKLSDWNVLGISSASDSSINEISSISSAVDAVRSPVGNLT